MSDKKDKKSLLTRMNDNSSKAWNEAWKEGNLMNSIGAIGSGLSGVIGAGVQNAQIADTTEEEAMIEGVENTQFGSGSYDNLMASFDSNAMARTNYTADEVRGLTDGQMVGNTLGGIASGAAAGAKVGGIWGGIAGGVIGLGSGIAGIFSGNRKARNKAIALNDSAQEANASYLNNFSNSVENTKNTMFNNSLLNVSAYGGPLYPLTGGFNNGITFINEGGTHEENPFGGVPVGVDKEGTPNLVEEGEVIWQDYVFSNRLKPTKKQLADGGFKDKYQNWTFAKIVEDLQKESSENPIDFITQNTLDDNLQRVLSMQEEVRVKKNKTDSNRFDIGGYRKKDLNRIKKYRETDPAWFNVLKDFYFPTTAKDLYEEDFNAAMKDAFLNKYTPETNLNLSGMGIEYTTPDIPEYVDVVEDLVNEAPLPTIFVNDVVNNTITKSKQPVQFTSLRTDLSNELDVTPIKPVVGKAFSNTETGRPVNTNLTTPVNYTDDEIVVDRPSWQEGLRFASPFIQTGTLLNNLRKPDYSGADRIEQAARNIPGGSFTPLGDYVNLQPLDRNYYLNPMLATSRSTSRAIQNQGLNAGQTMAGLLDNQYNTNTGIGTTLMQMEQENMNREMQKAQFNRSTNQANAQMAMQALQMGQQRASNILNATSQAVNLRNQLDAMRSQAISNSLTSIGNDLTGIGQEAVQKDWLQGLLKTGALRDYTKVAAKNGGMLTRNKRRRK